MDLFGGNRILAAVAAAEKAIADMGLPAEKLEELSRTLDIGLDEIAVYQTRKSLAQQSGVITLEEASTLYAMLGYSPETFNAQSVAAKLTLSQFFLKLLDPK